MYVNLTCSYQNLLQLLRKHNSKAKDFKYFWLKCYTWVLVVRVLFPGGTVVKNLPANAEDSGSTPRWGRSPGVGNGNPLQCSCLENLMDRGAWRATVHRAAKSQTQLSNWACTHADHQGSPSWACFLILKLSGKARWLKPSTLARNHSNHLHASFYHRRSW